MSPTANGPNLRQTLEAAQTLGLDRLDAQLLMLHVLGRAQTDRAWLLAHDNNMLAEQAGDALRQLCLRRLAGEPLAYLVGRKAFYGLDLQVDANVLIPRPDTETLVDWALELLVVPEAPPVPHILDLGTGSGAIALAVAHGLKTEGRPADILAVDASPGALAVAQGNATRLALPVTFLASNWFEKVSGHFHLILSNPPYIAEGDAHLPALAHEPRQALTAGIDGLEDIRRIVRNAPAHLHPGAWLLLEHGYDQAAAVAALMAEGGFEQVGHRQDLAGIERCTGGQWPGQNLNPQSAG